MCPNWPQQLIIPAHKAGVKKEVKMIEKEENDQNQVLAGEK